MGHETEFDKQKLIQLENSIDLTESPIEQLLELSEMYIEPFHTEEKAIDLLGKILQKYPENSQAKILLAYCHIYYSMDDNSLKETVELLTSINEGEQLYGAAVMMVAEILDDLNNITNEKTIELLEKSIKSEPSWVFNHHRLAWAYNDVGRTEDAIKQLNEAIKNVKENRSGDFFDENIAGKYYPKKYLEDDIKKIESVK